MVTIGSLNIAIDRFFSLLFFVFGLWYSTGTSYEYFLIAIIFMLKSIRDTVEDAQP